MADLQESKSERVTAAVTPTEKRYIELVLLKHKPEGGVGELLRARSLTDVISEGERLMDALEAHTNSKGEAA